VPTSTGREVQGASVDIRVDRQRLGWPRVLWKKLRRIGNLLGLAANDRTGQIDYAWYSQAEVAAYFEATHDPQGYDAMDSRTYADLDGPSYARLFLGERSIFARQFFEHRLRSGAPASEANAFAHGVFLLANDGAASAALRELLGPLRRARQEVASILFRPGAASVGLVSRWLRHVDTVGYCTVALAALWPTGIAISLLLAFLACSFWVQLRCYATLKAWTTRRDALGELVLVGLRIYRARAGLPAEIIGRSLTDRESLERLAAALRPGMLSRNSITAEYANLLFLYEYARAQKESESLLRVVGGLQEVFQAVARLEVQLAMADSMRNGLKFCRPAAATHMRVACTSLIHPLVARPSGLNIDTNFKSMFVSGKNGAGKSTLLRAVGLSLAAYRAFGFAHADSASLPRVAIWSSMQAQDSIESGQSLYMAELERASLLLKAGASAPGVVFLIDELFRGTNYLESVSASAAALNRLAGRNIVLAASHNIVLATLLRERFEAVRVLQVGSGELRLEGGVAEETNGVELMTSYGFGDRVVDQARAIACWYSDYIANPDNIPRQLFGRS
jgi:hypothetical protein